MVREIRARYYNGKIEPLEELGLLDGEEIIITVKKAPSEATPIVPGKDAFDRAAGEWKDLVDTDALLRDFKESRKIGARKVQL